MDYAYGLYLTCVLSQKAHVIFLICHGTWPFFSDRKMISFILFMQNQCTKAYVEYLTDLLEEADAETISTVAEDLWEITEKFLPKKVATAVVKKKKKSGFRPPISRCYQIYCRSQKNERDIEPEFQDSVKAFCDSFPITIPESAPDRAGAKIKAGYHNFSPLFGKSFDSVNAYAEACSVIQPKMLPMQQSALIYSILSDDDCLRLFTPASE